MFHVELPTSGSVVAAALVWLLGTAIQAASTYLFLSRSNPRKHFARSTNSARRSRLASSRSSSAPLAFEPLSVLKPLKGRDPALEENLRSFFTADYPKFEVLFCLESASDPAYPVVEKLIREYPAIPARVFFSASAADLPNPKISNLRGAYLSARYDLTLIADSNIRLTRDGLKNLVADLDSGAGIVTALVRGVDPRGMAAELEALHLNT